jgi:hypothetical protein
MATNVNITVTINLPLETISTIFAADGAETNQQVVNQVAPKATAAVVHAVKAPAMEAKQKPDLSNNERSTDTISGKLLNNLIYAPSYLQQGTASFAEDGTMNTWKHSFKSTCC